MFVFGIGTFKVVNKWNGHFKIEHFSSFVWVNVSNNSESDSRIFRNYIKDLFRECKYATEKSYF